MKVHPTSIIQGDVELADGVEIGPYCLIQGRVKIGKGTFVEGHVTLGSRHGIVEIGENNHLAPGSAIGGPPQDIGYKNEATTLRIGNNNVIREFSTINIATTKGTKVTSIGNNNYLMAYTHVGHDCEIHNNVVIANNTNLGGHTVIEDNVTIGGVCAFNQFSRIGKGSFIAGCSVVNKDILPFSKAQGNYAVCRATNKIGLARRGFSPEEVENVHRAIRIVLMGTDTIEEALARIEAKCQMSENIQYFVNFIRSSKRGIAK
ncbi:MAG: acyl-ACP--UDP-N-acetylglucosamine O-acyltransferase [Bdellovibrionaceae bacterium]|nr:acyl-ACP--UDP-N-acetylglucosamine O-acyltransferase [Pseudobdellovibrionaceae bacterium]